ncbi:MAG: histidine kinase N-terminal 7TM domain-containing protein [Candidatus Margulisbacteria bacterium]|nr:histidine kinase N-terminal 7TM domain-containing protein [Candidatus Margulisiibacteriota bacterium]
MTPFVFFYSAAAIFAGFASIVIGFYVLFRSRAKLNTVYFFLTAAIGLNALAQGLFRAAPNPALAEFWHETANFAWLLAFTLYLHFALVFSHKKWRILPFLYLSSLLMFILYVMTPSFCAGHELKYYGYAYISGLWDWWYMGYYTIFILTGMGLVYQVYKRDKRLYVKKQASYILLATIIPYVIGTVLDQVLTKINFPTLPLAAHITSLTIWLIGYTLVRYAPVSWVSKEQIAEVAAQALGDPLILTDLAEVINYVNQPVSKLTGYRSGELLGKKINFIFSGELEGFATIRKKDRGLAAVSFQKIPISGGRGFVYMIRDLSPVMKAKAEIEKMNLELKNSLERENQLIKYLHLIVEADQAEKLQAVWAEIGREAAELLPSLKPAQEMIAQYLVTVDEARRSRDELTKKTAEAEWFNKFMVGRDAALKELQTEIGKYKTT